MDKDNCQDLVVSCTGSGRMSVLINRGTCGGGEGFTEPEGCPEGVEDYECELFGGYSWNSIEGPFDSEEE